jgi:hypothetical protein
MKEDNNMPERNRPSKEGRDNDPNVRDYSAIQPGVNTISSSDTDEANKDTTQTASDGFRTAPRDDKADTRFDDVSE